MYKWTLMLRSCLSGLSTIKGPRFMVLNSANSFYGSAWSDILHVILKSPFNWPFVFSLMQNPLTFDYKITEWFKNGVFLQSESPPFSPLIEFKIYAVKLYNIWFACTVIWCLYSTCSFSTHSKCVHSKNGTVHILWK